MTDAVPSDVDEMQGLLDRYGYLADRALATSITLALALDRPLLLEGEAGVGKTEVAKVLSMCLGRRLIRLQCYEGLDVSSALYEWNYARQMIEIRLAESAALSRQQVSEQIFSSKFLLERPLLQALRSHDGRPAVLLIDELDRADEPFEAFLLEILSDFQVSIPEFGVVRAEQVPSVIITSNRTREIHDALKRRCFYHWIDYPTPAREFEIVRKKLPNSGEILVGEIVDFVQALRRLELFKFPGVAETIDWAAALGQLGIKRLSAEAVEQTLGILLKYQDDIETLRGGDLSEILARIRPN